MTGGSKGASAPCPACERTEARQARVRLAFWQDDRLVVIEDVPALVCNSCGEQFYDDASVRLVDRMRQSGFPPEDAVREVRVPVFSCAGFETTGKAMSPEMALAINK
jgi:YgiT-type zinc finger domain-containing protein